MDVMNQISQKPDFSFFSPLYNINGYCCICLSGYARSSFKVFELKSNPARGHLASCHKEQEMGVENYKPRIFVSGF